MKTLLARLPFPRAIGAYVADNKATVSLVSFTLLGPIEVERREATYGPEEMAQGLCRLLQEAAQARPGHGLPVCFGLPAERLFFSARPIRSDNVSASPTALLREALQSSSISVDDMAVDVIKAQPEQRTVAIIAACRKSNLAPLEDVLADKSWQSRVEPAPCALLRAGVAAAPNPWKAGPSLRIFLGQTHGLAVVVAGGLPIVWRPFLLPPGEEAQAIRTAARSAAAILGPCGIEGNIGAVLVHGRPELAEATSPAPCPGALGIGDDVRWSAGPDLSAASIAYGLALGAASPGPNAFDLTRARKPAPSLAETLPWREACVQLFLVACLAAYLVYSASNMEADAGSMRLERQTAPGGLGGASEANLRKERKELADKVEALRQIAGTRARWSEFTALVAACLPKGATLLSLAGTSDLPGASSKSETRRSLVLRASAPVRPGGGTVPPEVEAFLAALRTAPAIRREFPHVELGDIRQREATTKGGRPSAIFTIVCLPPAQAASPKKAPAGKK